MTGKRYVVDPQAISVIYVLDTSNGDRIICQTTSGDNAVLIVRALNALNAQDERKPS